MISRYHSNSNAPGQQLKIRRAGRRAIFLPAIAAISVFPVIGCSRSVVINKPITGTLTLAQAKKAHPTHLTHYGAAPQEYDSAVPADARVVSYMSGTTPLTAWLGLPSSPGPHPAVLFSHGGFSLGAGDFEDVRPFVDAGYVVLVPTYRGENGNKGAFERYFGEVDDALAALEYLRALPGVDSNRLFVIGHSVGGTTAMLLAESSTHLRGAAACGAFPNLTEDAAVDSDFPQDEYPFDAHDRFETDLRSPGLFVKDLHCPLSIYNSDSDDLYVAQAAEMNELGDRLGKHITNETFSGTSHYSALAPAVAKAIVAFGSE